MDKLFRKRTEKATRPRKDSESSKPSSPSKPPGVPLHKTFSNKSTKSNSSKSSKAPRTTPKIKSQPLVDPLPRQPPPSLNVEIRNSLILPSLTERFSVLLPTLSAVPETSVRELLAQQRGRGDGPSLTVEEEEMLLAEMRAKDSIPSESLGITDWNGKPPQDGEWSATSSSRSPQLSMHGSSDGTTTPRHGASISPSATSTHLTASPGSPAFNTFGYERNRMRGYGFSGAQSWRDNNYLRHVHKSPGKASAGDDEDEISAPAPKRKPLPNMEPPSSSEHSSTERLTQQQQSSSWTARVGQDTPPPDRRHVESPAASERTVSTSGAATGHSPLIGAGAASSTSAMLLSARSASDTEVLETPPEVPDAPGPERVHVPERVTSIPTTPLDSRLESGPRQISSNDLDHSGGSRKRQSLLVGATPAAVKRISLALLEIESHLGKANVGSPLEEVRDSVRASEHLVDEEVLDANGGGERHSGVQASHAAHQMGQATHAGYGGPIGLGIGRRSQPSSEEAETSGAAHASIGALDRQTSIASTSGASSVFPFNASPAPSSSHGHGTRNGTGINERETTPTNTRMQSLVSSAPSTDLHVQTQNRRSALDSPQRPSPSPGSGHAPSLSSSSNISESDEYAVPRPALTPFRPQPVRYTPSPAFGAVSSSYVPGMPRPVGRKAPSQSSKSSTPVESPQSPYQGPFGGNQAQRVQYGGAGAGGHRPRGPGPALARSVSAQGTTNPSGSRSNTPKQRIDHVPAPGVLASRHQASQSMGEPVSYGNWRAGSAAGIHSPPRHGQGTITEAITENDNGYAGDVGDTHTNGGEAHTDPSSDFMNRMPSNASFERSIMTPTLRRESAGSLSSTWTGPHEGEHSSPWDAILGQSKPVDDSAVLLVSDEEQDRSDVDLLRSMSGMGKEELLLIQERLVQKAKGERDRLRAQQAVLEQHATNGVVVIGQEHEYEHPDREHGQQGYGRGTPSPRPPPFSSKLQRERSGSPSTNNLPLLQRERSMSANAHERPGALSPSKLKASASSSSIDVVAGASVTPKPLQHSELPYSTPPPHPHPSSASASRSPSRTAAIPTSTSMTSITTPDAKPDMSDAGHDRSGSGGRKWIDDNPEARRNIEDRIHQATADLFRAPSRSAHKRSLSKKKISTPTLVSTSNTVPTNPIANPIVKHVTDKTERLEKKPSMRWKKLGFRKPSTSGPEYLHANVPASAPPIPIDLRAAQNAPAAPAPRSAQPNLPSTSNEPSKKGDTPKQVEDVPSRKGAGGAPADLRGFRFPMAPKSPKSPKSTDKEKEKAKAKEKEREKEKAKDKGHKKDASKASKVSKASKDSKESREIKEIKEGKPAITTEAHQSPSNGRGPVSPPIGLFTAASPERAARIHSPVEPSPGVLSASAALQGDVSPSTPMQGATTPTTPTPGSPLPPHILALSRRMHRPSGSVDSIAISNFLEAGRAVGINEDRLQTMLVQNGVFNESGALSGPLTRPSTSSSRSGGTSFSQLSPPSATTPTMMQLGGDPVPGVARLQPPPTMARIPSPVAEDTGITSQRASTMSSQRPSSDIVDPTIVRHSIIIPTFPAFDMLTTPPAVRGPVSPTSPEISISPPPDLAFFIPRTPTPRQAPEPVESLEHDFSHDEDYGRVDDYDRDDEGEVLDDRVDGSQQAHQAGYQFGSQFSSQHSISNSFSQNSDLSRASSNMPGRGMRIVSDHESFADSVGYGSQSNAGHSSTTGVERSSTQGSIYDFYQNDQQEESSPEQEQRSSQAVEVTEYADGRVVWNIVNALRNGGGAERGSFDVRRDMRDSIESTRSNVSNYEGSQQADSDHGDTPWRVGPTEGLSFMRRPETRVYYTSPTDVADLIDHLSTDLAGAARGRIDIRALEQGADANGGHAVPPLPACAARPADGQFADAPTPESAYNYRDRDRAASPLPKASPGGGAASGLGQFFLRPDTAAGAHARYMAGTSGLTTSGPTRATDFELSPKTSSFASDGSHPERSVEDRLQALMDRLRAAPGGVGRGARA